MSGAHKLLILLAASSGVLSSGQFLKPMVTKSFSSSWMSSSSWVPGRDGQMHQQVHEVRSETFHDHGMAMKRTESEIACKDGLCQQTVSVEKPGSLTVMTQQAPAAQARWGHSIHFPARLRAMLQGLSFPTVYVEEREAPVTVAFLAPRPEPARAVPAPRTAAAPGAQDMTGPAFAAPLAALAGAGTMLAALIVAAVNKRQSSGSLELPLQTLGEPLAPAQEAGVAARPKAAAPALPKEAVAATEAMPVAAYLDRVYTRAVVMAETAAAKAYLYRVYERGAA